MVKLEDRFKVVIKADNINDPNSFTDVSVIDNYPQEGVSFIDITSVLLKPGLFAHQIDAMYRLVGSTQFDCILGIESRGFIYASALAVKMELPLVLARKKGKLPREIFSAEYQKEYGTDYVDIHKEDIKVGAKVLIVDDILATGGTAYAVAKLLRKQLKVSRVEILTAYTLSNVVNVVLSDVLDKVHTLVELY